VWGKSCFLTRFQYHLSQLIHITIVVLLFFLFYSYMYYLLEHKSMGCCFHDPGLDKPRYCHYQLFTYWLLVKTSCISFVWQDILIAWLPNAKGTAVQLHIATYPSTTVSAKPSAPTVNYDRKTPSGISTINLGCISLNTGNEVIHMICIYILCVYVRAVSRLKYLIVIKL